MSLRRLQIALGGYVLLGLAGAFLTSGNVRYVLWLVLGGLALKTVAAYRIAQHDQRDKAPPEARTDSEQ